MYEKKKEKEEEEEDNKKKVEHKTRDIHIYESRDEL